MANFKPYILEITLSILAFIFLWFVLTNANSNLGNAYLWAIAISLFLLLINILVFDKKVDVTFQKVKGKWVETIFQGVLGWVMILVSSFLIFKVVDPLKANFNSIISSLGAANPAFSNSKILNWVVVSFAIGYGETQLFGRLMEFLADRFHIQINRKNMLRTAFVVLVIVLSILFALFHITAKGVEATNSLIVVALMMAISLFMIAWNNGETRQSVLVHVISNGVAGITLLMAGGTLFG
jgi:hypothetical protein